MAPAGLRTALDSNDAAPVAKFLRTCLPASGWDKELKVLKQAVSILSSTWDRELDVPEAAEESMITIRGRDISRHILGHILEFAGEQRDQLRTSSVSKEWWRTTSRLPAWSTVGGIRRCRCCWSRMGWLQCLMTLEAITRRNPERLITGFCNPGRAKIGAPRTLASVAPHLEMLDLSSRKGNGKIDFREWGKRFPRLKRLAVDYMSWRGCQELTEMITQIGQCFPVLQSFSASLSTLSLNRDLPDKKELEAAAILAIAENFSHLQTLDLRSTSLGAGATAADVAAFGALGGLPELQVMKLGSYKPSDGAWRAFLATRAEKELPPLQKIEFSTHGTSASGETPTPATILAIAEAMAPGGKVHLGVPYNSTYPVSWKGVVPQHPRLKVDVPQRWVSGYLV